MAKRHYEQPKMRIVELQYHSRLLEGSPAVSADANMEVTYDMEDI